ncbi:hypothetical protein GCM10022288_15920 [Gryllotalpicola kribbensis]|uniref:RNA polymerase sigma-70 region 4 domain-containing protein n=1 Tax=Gryllotalpicola kribbensis TaxID=993084 RepID=A0ABP8ARX4_9MICO
MPLPVVIDSLDLETPGGDLSAEEGELAGAIARVRPSIDPEQALLANELYRLLNELNEDERTALLGIAGQLRADGKAMSVQRISWEIGTTQARVRELIENARHKVRDALLSNPLIDLDFEVAR